MTPETQRVRSVEEVARTIEYEIQINGLWKEDSVGFAGLTQDGKLTVASVITQDRTSIHTSLVAAVESKKLGLELDMTISQINSYNQALDDTLTIINSIFKE